MKSFRPRIPQSQHNRNDVVFVDHQTLLFLDRTKKKSTIEYRKVFAEAIDFSHRFNYVRSSTVYYPTRSIFLTTTANSTTAYRRLRFCKMIFAFYRKRWPRFFPHLTMKNSRNEYPTNVRIVGTRIQFNYRNRLWLVKRRYLCNRSKMTARFPASRDSLP